MSTKQTNKPPQSAWTLVRPGPPETKETKAFPPPNLAAVKGRRAVRRKPGRRLKAKRRNQVPSLPPTRDRISMCSAVMRYSITTNASAASVTRASMASICGGIVTVANTTVTLWASSYKLKKIVVWPAAGSTVTLDGVIGGTAEQALQRETLRGSDLPTGITVDKPVVFVPNSNSYLSMWQATGTNGTDQFLSISGSTGAIFDIHIAFTHFSGIGAVGPTTTTSSTVPLGDVVYMPLDTGNKITAIALNGANH